jgi:hypothetical protein
MIVARFLRAANLILQSENDRGRVLNGKWVHSSMKPQSHRYAQLLMSSCLATFLRQQGLKQDWIHDFILSKVIE